MYYRYANSVSMSLQIIFSFAVAQILKVWPKALTRATLFECGAKKALGQLVLLD